MRAAAFLLVLACSASGQIVGTREAGRGAPAPAWPTYQTTFAPCFEDDPDCAAEGPRWVPERETVETIRALVVAFFRAQVAAGRLAQDTQNPCCWGTPGTATWGCWDPAQLPAGVTCSGPTPWDAIRPTFEFSMCFFSVPMATDGSGRPPATLCAAGTANGRTGVVTVSIAERDRTLALIAWETANYTTARARLWDPAGKAALADGPWIGRATNFAMQALQ